MVFVDCTRPGSKLESQSRGCGVPAGMENGFVTCCGRGFCLKSAGKTTGKCADAHLPAEWLIEEHVHSDGAATALFNRYSGMVTASRRSSGRRGYTARFRSEESSQSLDRQRGSSGGLEPSTQQIG